MAQSGGGGFRVEIETQDAVVAISNVLEDARNATKSAPKGPIHFILSGADLPGEVDIELGRDFPVTPQIKGALKSLPGVVMVEDI